MKIYESGSRTRSRSNTTPANSGPIRRVAQALFGLQEAILIIATEQEFPAAETPCLVEQIDLCKTQE
jgi:hypothetical protein